MEPPDAVRLTATGVSPLDNVIVVLGLVVVEVNVSKIFVDEAIDEAFVVLAIEVVLLVRLLNSVKPFTETVLTSMICAQNLPNDYE